MTKDQLRTIYKTKRQSLSADELARASEHISAQFQAYLVALTPAYIHIFLPIRQQNEVDTWLIIYWLWERHPASTVVTSVSDFKTGVLSHFALTPATKLLTNRYNIPEPVTGVPISLSNIDMVLVPLLIFDRQGHRVGYGRGFYDRFLAECRPDCLKVGLSLFEPVERITNILQTDVRLTDCLTTTDIIHFDFNVPIL